jgi:hypothetical protein
MPRNRGALIGIQKTGWKKRTWTYATRDGQLENLVAIIDEKTQNRNYLDTLFLDIVAFNARESILFYPSAGEAS